MLFFGGCAPISLFSSKSVRLVKKTIKRFFFHFRVFLVFAINVGLLAFTFTQFSV